MPVNDVIALAIGIVACITDVRSARIPNALTFSGVITGLLFHTFAPSGAGFAASGEGCLVGLAVFFLPFALGGLGAGDVKLLAALGAWLGPTDIVWSAVYTAIAGAALSLAVAIACGYVRTALSNIWMLLCHWSVVGIRPLRELSLEGGGGPRLAYAIPILLGLTVTLWLR
jgi:prepilin peptidase CpaA